MRKRIGSTLLALAMCLSLLPTAAFATVLEPDPAGTSIVEVTLVDTTSDPTNPQEVTVYFCVVEALAWYIQQPTTTKIKLLDDIEFTSEQAANCFRHNNGLEQPDGDRQRRGRHPHRQNASGGQCQRFQ